MGAFDIKWFNKAIGRNDYTTAINYLKQYRFDDPNVQKQVNEQIRSLERYGSMASAVLNKADIADRDKIAFHLSRMGDPSGTDYGKAYLNYINTMGNKGSSQAAYFEYRFDDPQAYNRFKAASNLDIKTLNPGEGASGYYTENGVPVVRIYRDQFASSEYFNNITKGLKAAYDTWEDGSQTPLFRTVSYDADGNKLVSKPGMFKEQSKGVDYIDEAEAAYNRLKKEGFNTTYQTELISKGYMSQAEKTINERIFSGQLDKVKGEFGLNVINNYYKRLLYSADLANYDVYAVETNKEGEAGSMVQIDQETSRQYNNLLRNALEENRVTYTAGAAGGRVGTVITISPKLDKDQLGENYKRGIQMFVPELLEEDARQVMDSDPDAAVTVKRAEHMAFNHPYDLFSGGSLTDFGQDGSATLISSAGTRPVSAEEVNQIMLQQETIRNTAYKLEDVKLEQGLNDEAVKALAQQYAINLYSYFNNGATLETATTPVEKSEIYNGVQELMELILSRLY